LSASPPLPPPERIGIFPVRRTFDVVPPAKVCRNSPSDFNLACCFVVYTLSGLIFYFWASLLRHLMYLFPPLFRVIWQALGLLGRFFSRRPPKRRPFPPPPPFLQQFLGFPSSGRTFSPVMFVYARFSFFFPSSSSRWGPPRNGVPYTIGRGVKNQLPPDPSNQRRRFYFPPP